jgi:hypothetical protein
MLTIVKVTVRLKAHPFLQIYLDTFTWIEIISLRSVSGNSRAACANSHADVAYFFQNLAKNYQKGTEKDSKPFKEG